MAQRQTRNNHSRQRLWLYNSHKRYGPSSSRRSSTSSTGGLVSPQPPPELVLVNEVESPNQELNFSSDNEMSDEFSARLDRLTASAIPPLSLVLLYLSVPYLKLGPMFLAFSDAPLSHTIPTLIVCALFAALTRRMWYLLARYLRKTDTEDVILDVLARGVVASVARTRGEASHGGQGAGGCSGTRMAGGTTMECRPGQE
jgi:hypothetical protein